MKVSATLLVVLIATLAETQAWTIPTPSSTSASTHLVSRTDVFKQALKKGGAALTIATLMTNTVTAAPSVANAETTSEGVTYEVIKKGDGPQPAIGELVAIRFAAYVAASGNKIDDIFDSPEPYYTRLGSGGLLKGVELTLPNMRLGDRWKLTIPGPLAFGAKGRPASAGKPRIPADAEIIFEVEMVGLPGKEPELIDLIGDDY